MSAKKLPWLEYRLDALTLRRSQRIRFPSSARLLYNPADNIVAIELSKTESKRIITQNRLLLPGATRSHFELSRIEYAMLIEMPDGQKETLRFFHPMQPGNGVTLTTNDQGELFFMNKTGRPLFSKDYTLRDVSQGKIDSDFPVWQFHGWKHEH